MWSKNCGRFLVKAIVCHRYGSPDVLRCEDVETPVAADHEVLIQVRAAAVNPLDWRLLQGRPYLSRIFFGLRRPKISRPGRDVAGVVEAVGRNVTRFKPGDEVFGGCRGAFAEYACAGEAKLALKPSNLSFEHAASAPVAGLTALQGLRDTGHIQPGQKVLINGASGGVGTFAVQIAKSFGADVTGVCSTPNVAMVRSIGADRVIDYTREDFTQDTQRYDVIYDCIGNHSLPACRRVLSPQGICVLAGGPHNGWIILSRMLEAVVLSRFVSQNFVSFMARFSQADLTILGELMESGKVAPVIDRRYTLSEVPEALRYLEQGHVRGKLAVTVEHDRKA